jgi:plastocyanin
VSVIDGAFNPASVSVTTGTTVTWTWTTSTTHNVTFNDAALGGSGDQSSGTFQKAFANAGTFGYECTLHAGMTGTVTVQ